MLTYFDLRNVTSTINHDLFSNLTREFCLGTVTYVILGVKQQFPSFRSEHVLFNPLVKGQTRVLLKHVGAYAHLLICTEKHMQAPDTTITDHETLNEWLRVGVPLAAHHMLITTTPWLMCWQETARTVAAECLKTSVCLRQLRRVEKQPVVQTLCQALFFVRHDECLRSVRPLSHLYNSLCRDTQSLHRPWRDKGGRSPRVLQSWTGKNTFG